jgi:hypothetical protein
MMERAEADPQDIAHTTFTKIGVPFHHVVLSATLLPIPFHKMWSPFEPTDDESTG